MNQADGPGFDSAATDEAASGSDLAARPNRFPHEWVAEPPPDARLPPLRQLDALARRRARLAEAALARARHALTMAQEAQARARQTLDDRIHFVAAERRRLLEQRKADPDAGSALRRWREEDVALLGSIQPCRDALAASGQAVESAEIGVARAQQDQQRLAMRSEKLDLLIEQIEEEGH